MILEEQIPCCGHSDEGEMDYWEVHRNERGPYRNRYFCVSIVTISTCKEGKKIYYYN